MTVANHYVPTPAARTAWTTMPGLDQGAVGHVVQKLPLIRAMLAGARAEIACFHIEAKGRRRNYRCTLWRHSAAGGYDIKDGTSDMTSAMLSEICGSIMPLARDLVARWPEQARPPVIGIATDGHRIVFNAEHPSCAGEAWMSQHLSGRAPGAILSDDGRTGAIARICP